MWTKETVAAFMNEYGFKANLTKIEIGEIHKFLQDDEKLCGLLEGTLRKIYHHNINGNGLVIATNKRVVFYRKSFIGTETKEETPISRISSISYRKGILVSSVAITTANNDSEVDNCNNVLAEKFVRIVQGLIADAEAPKPIASAPAGNSDGNLGQLEKLFDLKQKGIITEEEFAAQKAKILGL